MSLNITKTVTPAVKNCTKVINQCPFETITCANQAVKHKSECHTILEQHELFSIENLI